MQRFSMAAGIRRAAATAVLSFAAAATAGAQTVHASFYDSYGSPNPFGAFSGGLLCTAELGTDAGFFIGFANAVTRSTICPSNPDALNPAFHIFGARFTGEIWAPTAGLYDLGMSADDGEIVVVNGTVVDNEWFSIKGGGPGDIVVNLNAGANTWQIDYNNSFTGGAFVRFNAGETAVSFAPEPSSTALVATGLIGVIGVGARRRRAARE